MAASDRIIPLPPVNVLKSGRFGPHVSTLRWPESGYRWVFQVRFVVGNESRKMSEPTASHSRGCASDRTLGPKRGTSGGSLVGQHPCPLARRATSGAVGEPRRLWNPDACQGTGGRTGKQPNRIVKTRAAKLGTLLTQLGATWRRPDAGLWLASGSSNRGCFGPRGATGVLNSCTLPLGSRFDRFRMGQRQRREKQKSFLRCIGMSSPNLSCARKLTNAI